LPGLTREQLIDVVRKHHPSSLASLKRSLNEENIKIGEEEFLRLIRQLQSEGAINLPISAPASFKEYLIDIWSTWWFYLAIIVAISELALALSNAATGATLFLRIVLGLGMLGIIPGFLTVLIVFPGGQINTLEKIALSIFLSVLISITVGVVLGLGPFFQPSNNIIILTIYVIVADIAAGYRSYNFLRKTS
jgi:uncharacterized membrane protein